MMVNEFGYQNYDCGASCQCMYQTTLQPHYMIDGKGVLEQFEYESGNTRKWVDITLGIVLGYRVLGWGITKFKRT